MDDENALPSDSSGPLDALKSLGESIKNLYLAFALGDTKTFVFLTYLYSIIFSVGLVISSPVNNPFLEPSLLSVFAIALFSFALGSLLRTYLVNIVASKVTMAACTSLVCIAFILHALFGLLTDQALSNGVVYLALIQISLIVGVLSGNTENSSWLGSALFMRHINSKLDRKGIEYLYWDDEGIAQLIAPSSVRVRWDTGQGAIMCYFQQKSIPFLHFTPVRRTGLRINSAYRIVIELFDEMNTSWHELIKKYRTSITHSEIRTSWLCLTLLSIPNDPNSLTIQRAKIPIGTLSLNVGPVVYNIDWSHPKMGWEDARTQVFETSKETPVLNTVLTSRRRNSEVLEFENNFVGLNPSTRKKLLRVYAQRSYFSLMVSLFHNLSGREGTVAELCRHSVQEFSRWFTKLIRDNNFSSISELNVFSHEQVLVDAPSCDDWGQKLSLGLENPSNLFLASHDRLTNYADESNCSDQIRSLIQTSISDTTSEIMRGNRKPPGIYGDQSTNPSILSDSSSLSIAHKASVLCGGLKLQFIHYLLNEKEGIR